MPTVSVARPNADQARLAFTSRATNESGLDSLAGTLPPIQWTGYDKSIGTYQGELVAKGEVSFVFERSWRVRAPFFPSVELRIGPAFRRSFLRSSRLDRDMRSRRFAMHEGLREFPDERVLRGTKSQ